ncbi:MAG: MarR family transcriptional regulator [Ignavibacteriota bacterium]
MSFWLLTIAGRGDVSQHQMAELCGLDPSSLVAILDGMEHRGLLHRQRNPSDRRVQWVQRTEEGDRVYALASPLAQKAEAQQLAPLPAAGPPAVGGRHAEIDCEFEITRDLIMKPFVLILVLFLAAAVDGLAQAPGHQPSATHGEHSAGVRPQCSRRIGEFHGATGSRHHHQRQHAESQRGDIRAVLGQHAEHYRDAVLGQVVAR